MVKFIEIKENVNTTLPSAPWSLKDTYKKTATLNGHTYELTKYVRDPNLWERLTCALSAAWLWLKSCGKDQKKITSQWDKALGRKQICLRFGTQKTPNDPPKPDLGKETIKLDGEYIQLYEQGLKALYEKKYDEAQEAFAEVAEQGYQPAFDHIRKLAEENHTDWEVYNKLIQNDKEHKLVIMHFTEKQRQSIKTAIKADDGAALHRLTLELIQTKKYPEAYLCGCEALKSGSQETLEVISQLKTTYPAQWYQEENLLDRPRGLKIQKDTLEAEKILEKANCYHDLLSFEDELILLDKDIQEVRKNGFTKQAVHFYRLALQQGNGHAMSTLCLLQRLGYVDSDTVDAARKEFGDYLNRIEAEAIKTKDLKLWNQVREGYNPLGFEEQEKEKAIAWLKEVDPAFEPDIERMRQLFFDHNLLRVCAQAAKLGDQKAMHEMNMYRALLPENFLKETRAAFAEAIQPIIQKLLGEADINDNEEKIFDLIDIYHELQDKVEIEKWDLRLAELQQKQNAALNADPNIPIEKERVLRRPYDQIYQEALDSLREEDYKSAKNAFVEVAKIGYQPALDYLRKLAEENHTDWEGYNTAIRYDDMDLLKKMQFTDQQRATILSAIESFKGSALHQLTLECMQAKKYPEAYLCGCEAIKLGSEETLKLINELKKTYSAPWMVHEEYYLISWRKITQFLDEDNPSKLDWRKCAEEYERLLSIENRMTAMDSDIQKCKKASLAQQAIYYYRQAVNLGDGMALRSLMELHQNGYLNEDEIKTAREERLECLKAIEAEAKKNNDLKLWIELKREYRLRNVEELDFDKAAVWLKEIAGDPAFEPNMRIMRTDEFNHNVVRVSAEAVKLGDCDAMFYIHTSGRVLPKNFFKETCDAFAKAIEPTLKQLLALADIKDNVNKIMDLRVIYRALHNGAELDKWTNRLVELGHDPRIPIGR